MKKFGFLAIIICLIFLTGCNLSFSDNLKNNNFNSTLIDASSSTNTEELISSVKPAVVGISATSGRTQSIGTGVCVKNGCYILTNNHVIENANSIKLYLSNGSTTSAEVVWKDSGADLAILKGNTNIPYLKMAGSGNYSAGDEVVAIGTPLALAFKHSATKGIISAVNRTISVDNNNGETTLNNLIQHDASINPGNSGGPLINMKGEVIGINTVKVSDAEGMGFAIPVDTFLPVVENVSTNGTYNTAYLGVFGYDAQLKNIGKIKNGYYIQNINQNSPAEKIGLQKGDIITKINGKNIDCCPNLREEIYKHQAGEKITITYERNGKYNTKIVELSEHPCCYKSKTIIEPENSNIQSLTNS